MENWKEYLVARNRDGPTDPAVTILAFEDYQCPVCRALEPHLRAIRRQFPEDVAIVRRHFPLGQHPQAFAAARAAECAGSQGRFGHFNAELYKQTDWMNGAGFGAVAAATDGLDLRAFEACVKRGEVDSVVRADIAAAQDLGAPGTPTLVINGVMHVALIDSTALAVIVREARGG